MAYRDIDKDERLRGYEKAIALGIDPIGHAPVMYQLRVNPYGINGEIMPDNRHSNFWCMEQSTNYCMAYFSYKALIGLIDPIAHIAFINTDYAHCSRTTSQHMTRFKRHIVQGMTIHECNTEYIWQQYYMRVGDDTPARILLED